MASQKVLLVDAGLKFPSGICAARGRLFVCDAQNGRVLSWSLGEQLSDETTLSTGLASPYSVCVGADGRVFVAEECGHCISTAATAAGPGTVVCGSPLREMGRGLDSLRRPYGVCVEESNSLLIADKENNRILRWAPGATAGALFAGGGPRATELGELNYPTDVCVTANSVVVCDMCNHRVVAYDVDGTNPRVIAGCGAWDKGDGPHQLDQPISVCFDSHCRLYVADCGNSRVQCFPAGAMGGTDGATVGAGLDQIHGICVHHKHVFVVQAGRGNVVMLQCPDAPGCC